MRGKFAYKTLIGGFLCGVLFILAILHFLCPSPQLSQPSPSSEPSSLYLFITNIFHLTVLVVGIFAAFLITFWALSNNWVKEKYCIALLVFTGFLIYEMIDYNPSTGKWNHDPARCSGSKTQVSVSSTNSKQQ